MELSIGAFVRVVGPATSYDMWGRRGYYNIKGAPMKVVGFDGNFAIVRSLLATAPKAPPGKAFDDFWVLPRNLRRLERKYGVDETKMPGGVTALRAVETG